MVKREYRALMALVAMGGGLFVALVVLEIGLRIFNPIHVPLRAYDIALPVNQRFETHIDGVEKMDAVQIIEYNSLGLRGPEPPADFDAYTTIVTVGGSTTASGGLTETNAWPHLVYESLHAEDPNLWLNNAGMNGHSTFGHLMLQRQFLLDIKPDYIVFLTGINDVGREDLTDFDHGIDPRQRDRAAFFIRYSELLSTLQVLWRSVRAARKGLGINGEVDFAHVGVLPKDAEEELRVLKAHSSIYVPMYAERIQVLIDETLAGGTRPILITQPALYGEGVDPTTGRDLGSMDVWGTRAGLRWATLELYNEQTRALARARGLPLIDLARTLDKDSRFYSDFIHHSIEGAAEIARQVSDGLRKQLRHDTRA